MENTATTKRQKVAGGDAQRLAKILSDAHNLDPADVLSSISKVFDFPVADASSPYDMVTIILWSGTPCPLMTQIEIFQTESLKKVFMRECALLGIQQEDILLRSPARRVGAITFQRRRRSSHYEPKVAAKLASNLASTLSFTNSTDFVVWRESDPIRNMHLSVQVPGRPPATYDVSLAAYDALIEAGVTGSDLVELTMPVEDAAIKSLIHYAHTFQRPLSLTILKKDRK